MTCSDLPTTSSKVSVDKVVLQVTSLTTTRTRSDVDTPRFSVMMRRKTKRNIPTFSEGNQAMIREQCLGSKSGSISKVSNSSGAIKTQKKSTRVEALPAEKKNSRKRYLMNSMSTSISRDRLKRLVLHVTTQKVPTTGVKLRFLSKKRLQAQKLKLR